MYISPTTPTGTGSRLESNMYTRAFAIGRPIGMSAPDIPRGQLHAVAFTAASVGPYKLCKDACGHLFVKAAQQVSGPVLRRHTTRASTLKNSSF